LFFKHLLPLFYLLSQILVDPRFVSGLITDRHFWKALVTKESCRSAASKRINGGPINRFKSLEEILDALLRPWPVRERNLLIFVKPFKLGNSVQAPVIALDAVITSQGSNSSASLPHKFSSELVTI
jgi:hypothetical protein